MAQPLHHHQPSADRRSRHRHVRGGRNADQPAAARRLDRAGTAGRTAGASHQLSRIAGAGPPLAWARHRFDVDFEVVQGVVHRAQAAATLERLRKAVAAHETFALAALSPLITITGSLIIALALAEGAIDLDTAWKAATVDEAWQSEKWGEDEEAAQRLA